MQRPGHDGGEGEACVTENGARAKPGYKQDGGHAVYTVSPRFPSPLAPWLLVFLMRRSSTLVFKL